MGRVGTRSASKYQEHSGRELGPMAQLSMKTPFLPSSRNKWRELLSDLQERAGPVREIGLHNAGNCCGWSVISVRLKELVWWG